jgi:hypothetical protein
MRDRSTSSAPELKARGYRALFVALLVYFATAPLVDDGGFFDVVLDLMIIGALLNSLRTVAQDWRIVAVAALFGAGAIALRPMLHLGVPLRPALIVSTASMLAFLSVVGAPLLVDVYRASEVSFRTILGACSMFLILGFIWFGIFTLIEIAEPGSFAFADTHASDVWQGSDEHVRYGSSVVARGQLFYFTFVTMTTLGFGDVLPVSAIARTYATLAAVFGQLFLAIMIARLVGIHSAHSRALRDSDSNGE